MCFKTQHLFLEVSSPLNLNSDALIMSFVLKVSLIYLFKNEISKSTFYTFACFKAKSSRYEFVYVLSLLFPFIYVCRSNTRKYIPLYLGLTYNGLFETASFVLRVFKFRSILSVSFQNGLFKVFKLQDLIKNFDLLKESFKVLIRVYPF